jgi:hypothetical protein
MLCCVIENWWKIVGTAGTGTVGTGTGVVELL